MHINEAIALDLIDTIAAQPELSTFSQMLTASGIAEIFAEGGEFTVFAPNNDAFRRLDPRLLLALLHDLDRTKVRNLVLFHVCMGRMQVAEPDTPINAGPVSRSSVSADDTDPRCRKRNIPATNGLIHEIGTVLTPATSPCVRGH